MTLSVSDIALIGTRDIYDPASTWDLVIPEPYIGLLLDRAHKAAIVALRGSTYGSVGDILVRLRDFLADLAAAAWEDAGLLGTVAAGFYTGIPEAWAILAGAIPADYRIVVTGHSLGASRGALLAGYALSKGRQIDACVLMGEPPSGCDELAALLHKVPVFYSFQNGERAGPVDLVDPVTLVPPWAEHSHKLIHVDHPAALDDPWGPVVGLHHSEFYTAEIPRLNLPPLVA